MHRIFLLKISHKHVYGKQPRILCNICNLWTHSSRAGITKKVYEDLQNSDNYERWFCRLCKIILISFFELTKSTNNKKNCNTLGNS